MTDVEAFSELHKRYQALKHEIAQCIVGQEQTVDDILNAIFSGGHALLIGVPGLAKTLLVNTLSQVLDLSYRRIQFTPDLMPSDITGSEILGEDRQFRFIKGPVFAHIILADEINRTPPKTQAALLEAMQERSVTVAGNTLPLPNPFFVLATQNPIEQEGTYPLPEAQLDRFMMSIYLDYPSFEDEVKIVQQTTHNHPLSLQKLLNADDILRYQQLIRSLPVADAVLRYAVEKTSATRPSAPNASPMAKKYLQWGAGPRASQYLIIGAKTHAALNGKYSPDREDVDAIALQVLRHRVVKNYRAEADGINIQDII